ncbi:chromate transporter [Clostridium aminobutyricum]|uniref:Chromate transporter n=1 Tax=Clostridium aminobutyricum TaxID=33953 RepID=A0A939DAI5_CLOAM|nr:chromate transporter [Clostridium aminobutyricum]MBN7774135.1 chromate transporter [Clostridium aminobutyricum]
MIYVTLFLTFFRIGIFSFGGGLAMLPLIFQTVQDFGFMSSEEFANLVALSQVTPGPVAVNAATYVGYDFAGFWGAFFATLGVSLPSFILVITVLKFLDKWNNSKSIDAAFKGIRPATVGLIGAAALFVGESALINKNNLDFLKSNVPEFSASGLSHYIGSIAGDIANSIQLIPCLIFIVTLILTAKFKMGPVKIIFMMAIAGVFFCS